MPSAVAVFFSFFPFIFISWRLITLQYCSGFCHTLTWISHGFICISHPNTPSHLPLYPAVAVLCSQESLQTCPNIIPAWLSLLHEDQVVLMVKNPPANVEDMIHRFDPWVGKMPWRRAWQPTPVFLPRERNLDKGTW